MSVIETNFGPVVGQITTKVLDPAGLNPTNIIRMADGWRLEVDWEVKGLLVVMLSGTWRLQAFLESLGPAPEIPIVNMSVPFSAGIGADPATLSYHVPINFNPNTPAETGVYRLVTVLTCLTPSNTPGPFAGFDQGPLLQFYVAP